MTKKILALVLCVAMLASIISVFSACTPKIKGENDTVGPHIYMYLADEVYDFDPMNAYTNDSTLKLASLLFEPLFKLDENGKVTKDGLVKKYKIIENEKSNEYKMLLTLKEAYWNDGTAITAGDIVYAWKRIMEVDASSPAASLLYDIKNARAVKAGEKSIDYLGIYDVEQFKLEIQFEGKIDYDQFLLNLTSYALCPIREDVASKNVDLKGSTEDWAKKASSIVCSGPFIIRESYYSAYEEAYAKKQEEDAANQGFEITVEPKPAGLILERNPQYYRDPLTDQFDKTVKISRIYVDWSLSDQQILEKYNSGEICYIGEVPLSIRGEIDVELSDALSTHTYFLNTNEEPFCYETVRDALSMAIDRQSIANEVVYAKVADALVPYGVFETKPKSSLFGTKYEQFRDNGYSIISANPNIDRAKELLKSALIDPTEYSFSITYAANDDVHKYIAESVCNAWRQLGFDVKLDPVTAEMNGYYFDEEEGTYKIDKNDKLVSTQEAIQGICDDTFKDRLVAGDFDVIALDLVAYSADAFQYLAQFAPAFSGEDMNMNQTDENGNPTYSLPTHVTGFYNEQYNDIINAVYFLPYYDALNSGSMNYQDFSIYSSYEDFRADIEKVRSVYNKYGIDTSEKKRAESRAKLLHEAEKILVDKTPVIPIIYNVNAYAQSENLKKVSHNYYGLPNFVKTTLKKYKDYMQMYQLGEFAPSDEE